MVEQEQLHKEMFAAALLRTPHDPFGAACLVFGMDSARALEASIKWIHDSFVLQRQAELLQEFGEATFMPSKLTLARRVYELAEDRNTDKKERIAAYKLYADIMGMIERQALIGHQTNVTQNRVMVVRDFGTDDQWESAALKQQTKLIEHARD